MRKTCFLSAEKPVTIRRWTFLDTSVTFTGSQDSCLRPRCAAIPAIQMPSFFPCATAEKNSLRPVQANASQVLRSASTPDSRSLLRRQARLAFLECSACGLLALWRRQDRTSRLAVRVAELYSAVRVLRGLAMSRHSREGGGRGAAA